MRALRGWPSPAHDRPACRRRPPPADRTSPRRGWSGRAFGRPRPSVCWSVRSRSTAPRKPRSPSVNSMRQAFLRFCSLERHSSIAERTSARRAGTGWRRCRRRRETSARCAWSAAGASAARRSKPRRSRRRRLRPCARNSPIMSGVSSAWSAVVTSIGQCTLGIEAERFKCRRDRLPGLLDESGARRSATRPRMRSGCWASTRIGLDSVARQQRLDRPSHHRHPRRRGSAP